MLKEFIPELTTPVTSIFNLILSTSTYPEQWVKEYHTPIPKAPIPESEDQLRNIALTSFFSKAFESFIFEWLWPYISPNLDPGQFGGIPGSSITHYIIRLTHFILSNLDENTPIAVLAALVDFSKAFNRMNHNILIDTLSKLGVPGWLLKLVIAYLTKQKMVVRYKGVTTEEQDMPGGSPQGTLLGMFLFIVQINDAGKSSDEIRIPKNLDENKDEERMKFVNDLTLLETINLKTKLCSNIDKSGPLNFHERHGHVIPPENS